MFGVVWIYLIIWTGPRIWAPLPFLTFDPFLFFSFPTNLKISLRLPSLKWLHHFSPDTRFSDDDDDAGAAA